MRIIGGQYKGRRFYGKIPSNIRPTTDNVRESIFNILANYLPFNDITVADIFAGTGMLGFETISREASQCFFFDNNFKSISFIKRIADNLNIPNNKFKIIKGDALKKIKTFKENYNDIQFDLIFIDPPYKNTIVNDVILWINQNGIISYDGIIVVEHSILNKIILPNSLRIKKSKVFGETQIDFVLNNNIY